jgi:hypothetical protein
MRSGRSIRPSPISALLRMPLKASTLRMRNAATSAGTNSGILMIEPMVREPKRLRRRNSASG